LARDLHQVFTIATLARTLPGDNAMLNLKSLPILAGVAALGAIVAASPAHASLVADGVTYTLFETTTANPLVDNFDLNITGINGPTDTEGLGRSGVESFAFGTIPNISTITAPAGFTDMTGGLNSMGCDGSGAFFCFLANTLPAFTPALTANSTLDFDFSVTLSSGNFSGFGDSFKIAWAGSKSSGTSESTFHSGYDLVSEDLPATPAPAPPIGQGLPVVLAVGGFLFGARLWERSNKRCSPGNAVPEATA
jgi:hypothetical protein